MSSFYFAQCFVVKMANESVTHFQSNVVSHFVVHQAYWQILGLLTDAQTKERDLYDWHENLNEQQSETIQGV